MLISGKKIRALYDKKKYSNSCCPKKNISKRKKKPSPPLCKLNGRSLTYKYIITVLAWYIKVTNGKVKFVLLSPNLSSY